MVTMQFDQTYIAIRQRDLIEILDLTLHVVRDHFVPLVIVWLIGCLPFMLFNWFFLRPLSFDYYNPENLALFGLIMAVLINSQSQMASIFVTNYLGQSMFSATPSVWEAIKSTFKTNFFFFWAHGVLRLVFPLMILCCFIDRNTMASDAGGFILMFAGLSLLGLIIRAARPFASEILALEKTPVRKSASGQISYGVRSRSLHKAANSELSGRFFIVALFSLPLTVVVLGSLLLVDSILSLHSTSEFLPTVFYFPLSLWIVSGLLAVARFLSYIDIRIRQEGWEVELLIRSEALKMEKATG